MAFNLQELASQLSKRNGLLRTNKFKIVLPLPPALQHYNVTNLSNFVSTNRDLEFWCEATNLPGIGLNAAEITRYGYGPSEKKPWGPVFTDLSCTFRGDGNGDVWQYLQTWLRIACQFQFAGPTDAGGLTQAFGSVPTQLPYEMAYKVDYMVDAELQLFDETGDIAIDIVLREAYPTFVGDTTLDWGDRDNYQRIPVTLSYFDWYSLSPAAVADQNQPVSASSPASG